MSAKKSLGPLLFFSSEGLFVCSFTLAKLISHQLPLGQLLWMRFAPALALIPFFWTQRLTFRVVNPRLMLLRSLLGVASICCLFYSLKWGDFGRMNIIYATGTLWAFFWALFVLKERPHWVSLGSIPIALIGLLLIFEPTFEPLRLADMVALVGSFLTAGVYVSLRELRKTHDSTTIVFCFFMTGLLISSASFVVHPASIAFPGWTVIGLAALTGVLGFAAQLLMTTGYRYCPVSVSSFIKLSSSVLMVGVGMWIFHDPFDLWRTIGMGMVMSGITLISVFQ